MGRKFNQHRSWLARTDRLPVLAVVGALIATAVQAQPAQIVDMVGIGAATCAQFNEETTSKPPIARNYVAWAQGFMSGFLLRSPAGVDENINLLPPNFPLPKQADFLRDFCRNNPDRDYSDGVIGLYQLLRSAPK